MAREVRSRSLPTPVARPGARPTVKYRLNNKKLKIKIKNISMTRVTLGTGGRNPILCGSGGNFRST
jgi:hypothetical protein